MEYYGLYGFAHPIKTSNVPNVPPSSAELHCVAPWRTSEWSHRVSADLTAGTRHLFHLVNDLFAKTKRTWTILIFKIIWVLIEKQHNYNYNYKCTTDIIRLYKRLQGIAVYNDSKLQSISWFPGSPNKTKPVGREVGPTHTMQLAYLIWYTGIHCWL